MTDCKVQMSFTPPDIRRIFVSVNCELVPSHPAAEADADTVMDSDGWSIDYSTIPPTLVFGAGLCERVRSMGNVPVYVFLASNGVC